MIRLLAVVIIGLIGASLLFERGIEYTAAASLGLFLVAGGLRVANANHIPHRLALHRDRDACITWANEFK